MHIISRFLLIISCILLLQPVTTAFPVEPAEEKQEQQYAKKNQYRSYFRPWKVHKTKDSGDTLLILFLTLVPIAGITLFIVGALLPSIPLWIIGLSLWGLFVLILSIAILRIYNMLSITNRDMPGGIGIGIVVLIMLTVINLFASFVGGLIPLIWGLIIGYSLMWITGAAFMAWALIFSTIIYKLLNQL